MASGSATPRRVGLPSEACVEPVPSIEVVVVVEAVACVHAPANARRFPRKKEEREGFSRD